MPNTAGESIEIEGVQKTNLGPVSEGEDIQIFEEGVLGGPVSDEFEDAFRFREKLAEIEASER